MIDAQRRSEACAIWQAGLAAVRSETLTARHLQRTDKGWSIHGVSLEPAEGGRVVVVGAGKAVAGMAAGWERAVGRDTLTRWHSSGWIQVPSNCVRPLQTIHVHSARASHANEPSAAGVWGANELKQRVASLDTRDVCICLLSGGASALLPALREQLQLDDLLTITRALSSAGATIQQINAVRKRLCVLLGGGLARACRAGRLITLVLSDILGDPLDLIGSGPTWCAADDQAEARDGLAVWNHYADRVTAPLATLVRQLLTDDLQRSAPRPSPRPSPRLSPSQRFYFCARQQRGGCRGRRRSCSAARLRYDRRSDATIDDAGRVGRTSAR